MMFKEGIGNAHFAIGKASELMFPDNSFDVVISDATLIYVGPDKIWQTMAKIWGIANKGLVLIERQVYKHPYSGVYLDGMWQRNYETFFKILSHNPSKLHIESKKITKDIWYEWSETGYVISVRK